MNVDKAVTRQQMSMRPEFEPVPYRPRPVNAGAEPALSFEGKIAWVAGGSSGVGRATATFLARLGARVAILDADPPEDRTPWARCDLGSSASADEAAERLTRMVGKADIFVYCGVTATEHAVTEYPGGLWDQTLATNLSGAFYSIRCCLPAMMESGWGRIVTITQDGGRGIWPDVAAYTSARAGLKELTAAAALESAGSGVTVNMIVSGPTDTTMALGSSGSGTTGRAKPIIPRGIMVDPSDIVRGVAFMCSGAGRSMTGQVLNIDAGGVYD